MSSVPRGLRAFNPGNIRKSSQTWVGQVPGGGKDAAFVTFTSPEYGLRALAKILLTYQNVHALYTIAAIIARWAPPAENDTASYVAAVAHEVGIGEHDHLNLHDPTLMAAMLRAITRHENGSMPYNDATITQALKLAGIPADAPRGDAIT